jgi:hypothetical protein
MLDKKAGLYRLFLCPWMGGMSQGARDGGETRADEVLAMLACTIINYGID